MHVAFRKVQASFASMSGAIQESISGIRVVKAFAQEEAELAKVDDVSMNFVKRNISLARITGIFHPFMNFVINISVIITLFFGGRAAIRGEITIGEFIAFFQYLGMLVWPMMAIGWLVDMYQRGTASLQRLNDIFVLKPEITDANADQSITEIQGAIEFKNLSFRYDESLPWVLKDISAGIDSGQTLAIVGPTGCGKTTLIELIARIYEPPEGSILIDGIPVDRIPLQTLRQEIVLVPQDIFLFSESLADNIRLADVNASMEQVYEAARIAQVYDEIMDFEHQFDTVVGERGVTLSGGQKQRVAIARALLTDPKVLILDDALSAVDTKTERYILESLIEARKNKTTIIIAHRISAIQHADKIMVLGQGDLLEKGNHESLMAQKGLYYDLFEKQRIRARLEGEEG
jgi:ATP-binding cassette subfamily B protein